MRRRNGPTDQPTDRPTDGWTDRQTDGWTDRPSYRGALKHLKNDNCLFYFSLLLDSTLLTNFDEFPTGTDAEARLESLAAR